MVIHVKKLDLLQFLFWVFLLSQQFHKNRVSIKIYKLVIVYKNRVGKYCGFFFFLLIESSQNVKI